MTIEEILIREISSCELSMFGCITMLCYPLAGCADFNSCGIPIRQRWQLQHHVVPAWEITNGGVIR